MKASVLPFDPGISGWDAILPDRPAGPELSDYNIADVVIIGAGFAGLSAARQLHQFDASLNIAVLEARKVAEGPAGRNSGFMIDLPHHLASKDYAGSLEKDRERTRLNRMAIDFAEEATWDYDMIDGTFEKSGKINAAATEKGAEHNRAYADHLENLGEPFAKLDATEMRMISGSDYYLDGLYMPGTAMLQPAAYVRQFADGLRRDRIRIYENSPVIEIDQEGQGWRVNTSKAQISAQAIILTNNGHLESFGFYSRRLIHIYLYASMTRVLTHAEERTLGGEAKWGFTPADPMGSTVRKISDFSGSRIVVRNSISWAPGRQISERAHEKFARTHSASFTNRFPMLGGVEMEYSWGGLLCLSRNSVPAFGEVAPNAYAACCQNGLGTAFGTLSGMTIAEKIMGRNSERTHFFDHQEIPTRLPPEPFARIGANLLFWWGEYKADREL